MPVTSKNFNGVRNKCPPSLVPIPSGCRILDYMSTRPSQQFYLSRPLCMLIFLNVWSELHFPSAYYSSNTNQPHCPTDDTIFHCSLNILSLARSSPKSIGVPLASDHGDISKGRTISKIPRPVSFLFHSNILIILPGRIWVWSLLDSWGHSHY